MQKTQIRQPRHQRAEIRTEVPGPRSRAIREKEERTLAPGLQGFALQAGIVVDQARGSAVTDVDGNTFLDIIGGIGVNGLGHSHPEWVGAIHKQVDRASVGSFTSEARAEFFERISKMRPAPKVHRTQLYSSGAEAVESALRLAKSYTGKSEFVSFWGGFHGKTMGALSLNGGGLKEGMGPMIAGNYQIPYADSRKGHEMSTDECISRARKQLKAESAGKIAAFIIEPMQGTAGNLIPPADFLPAVKSLAKEMGALLIADEMITGFGRTGKLWGVSHTGVEPDIVTLGKQFGGGFPVSAVMSTDEITAAKPWSVPSGSSSSYGGNPLASAAAAASLRIIEEEGLVENSARVGAHFLKKLQPFADKYSFIGDVRGVGLFLGIDFVKDKKTLEPMSKGACQRVFQECLKRGLLTMSYAPSFRIQPAMTIDEATIDEAVAILDEVFAQIEREKAFR